MDVNLVNIDWALVISVAVIAIVVMLIYVKVNLKICEPNEILIFSGRRRKLSSGEIVGYRIIRGGYGLRVPLIEKVNRLSLSIISITLEIEGALSNGMIPLSIVAIAHVKIASKEGQGLENAVERLLGKPSLEIETIAKNTIEGVLRGVIATFTPEEANYNRLELEKKVFELAKDELMKLGFTLDSVKIEEIKDSQGYLDAVGRQRNAIVRRDARIKEAEAEAEAKVVEYNSRKKASDVEFQSRTAMEEYESLFRERKAALDESTYQKEVKAEYAKKLAELRNLNELEDLKKDVNTKKYTAEVIIPAEAEKKAQELKAAGESSYLKEQGIAMAEAVNKMRAEWQNGNTKELFMLHLLPNIVDNVSRVLKDNLKVEKLVVMGEGGIPRHIGDVTSSVVSFIEQIKTATGVDLTKILDEKKSLPVKKEME